MTEEELHNEAHLNAEYEVREVLHATFYDERLHACRAAVLIEVLTDEFLQMDNVEEVSAVVVSLLEMIMFRNEQDTPLMDTAGSA